MRALSASKTMYTDIGGTGELKSAIRKKFLRENKLDYATPELRFVPRYRFACRGYARARDLRAPADVLVRYPYVWVLTDDVYL